MTQEEMRRIEQGPKFPLYINEDGSIGKIFNLGNGGYIKVNNARYVDEFTAIHKKQELLNEEYHNLLMREGVKAYRVNDGWVDRKRCQVTFFRGERTKGYYWGNLDLLVGDLIFIGSVHSGGRFARIISCKPGDGESRKYIYAPLGETLYGFNFDGTTFPFITKHNSPKQSLWQRLFGKKPTISIDIYDEEI